MLIVRGIPKKILQTAFVLSLVSYFIDVKLPEPTGWFNLEVETRWRATYAMSRSGEGYSKPSLRHSWSPDTTAVILNWSRLPNVIQLTKVMCTQLLDTIAVVFIWNNNPQALSSEDFSATGCPSAVLKIHNSPRNVYFQARFLACDQATTPYCFIQDDDYFVRPSIIRAMRARMSEITSTSLHLLPAFEMLYSQSSTITVGNINTLFAWLGHGTMVHRPQLQNFLKLLRVMNATEDVFKMADNYFTILSNKLPELWFDQNHELRGGTPFTVGTLGEERNNRHITNAGRTLDLLVRQLSLDAGVQYPYISLPTQPSTAPVTRAVCFEESCALETNVRILPVLPDQSVSSASEIVDHVGRRFEILGSGAIEHYTQCPPSFAVDGNPETCFRSVHDAASNDWIALDLMTTDFNHKALEMGIRGLQDEFPGKLECSDAGSMKFRECSVATGEIPHRKFRARLRAEVPHKWAVYEMWMRRRN